MIYTLTLNPSLDYILSLDDLKLGETNRADSARITIGGKGINVSVSLNRLGRENIAIAVVGGFTGDKIKDEAKKLGLQCEFLDLAQDDSRINIKIKGDVETEINTPGPVAPQACLSSLMNKFLNLKPDDVLVFSGSMPQNCPSSLYADLIGTLPAGIKVIADCPARQLKTILPLRPFLIKPNLAELSEFYGTQISPDEVYSYGVKLLEYGAQNVMISMGDKGGAFFSEDEKLFAEAAEGTAVNSIGAGDAMVAGFLAGYMSSRNKRFAFQFAMAAGAAKAFKDDFIEASDIAGLLYEIYVQEYE